MISEASIVWTMGPDEPGNRQMAIDRLMVHAAVSSGKIFARLYHFTPPCVSLGCFQRDDEIDADLCREAGIDITRRPTGGRAVLHKGDLVYSIAVPNTGRQPKSGKSLFNVEVYNRISMTLQHAMAVLNLAPEFSEESKQRSEDSLPRARLCFSSTTPYEVQVQGRKVVGSAQRWLKNVVLQHGSILVNDDHLQLVDLLPDLNDVTRTRLRDTIRRQTISLREAGFAGSEQVLSDILRDSFATTFGSIQQLDTATFMLQVNESEPDTLDMSC